MKDRMNPKRLPQFNVLRAVECRLTEAGLVLAPVEEEVLRAHAQTLALAADLLRAAAVDISALGGDACPIEVRKLFNDVPDLVALIVRRWWRAARQVRHLYPAGLQPEHLTFLIENDPIATDPHLPKDDGHTPQPEE